jgi:hypothetical protein
MIKGCEQKVDLSLVVRVDDKGLSSSSTLASKFDWLLFTPSGRRIGQSKEKQSPKLFQMSLNSKQNLELVHI